MHLHTAFLLSCFGIASNALEYEVREEADGRRIDNLELLHPLRHIARGAVRENVYLCPWFGNDVCFVAAKLPKRADSSSRNQPKFLFLEACIHMHTRVPEL